MRMKFTSPNANVAELILYVNMVKYAVNAKSAKTSVNMGDAALHAKSAEALLFVDMG